MREELLPASSKIAVAVKAMTGAETIRSLASQYQITKRSVWRYANKVRYHGPLRGGGGRPPTFDGASMNVLKQLCTSEEPPNREALEAEFLIQQKKTWCRLHHKSYDTLAENEGPKKLAVRTMWKYFKELNYYG